MKKALSVITALLCAGAVLSGCSSKNKETYIDIDSNYQVLDSELADKLQQANEPLNTTVTDSSPSPPCDLGMPNGYHLVDFDDKNMYLFGCIGYWGGESNEGQQLIACTVDLQSGKVTEMCTSPGCTHDGNLYPDCIYNMLDFEMLTQKAVDGEIWYIGKDSNGHFTNISAVKDGKSRVIFENTYYTAFEEGTLAGNKMTDEDETYLYELRDFYIDAEHIYAVAPSYMFIIDRETMQAGEIINLGDDCEIFINQIYDGKAYVTNDFRELFTVDLETEKITKLADKMGYDLTIYGNKIYYDIVEFGSPNKAYLWRCDLDGKNSEMVKEDITQYVLKDGKLFYVPYSAMYTGDMALKCYDIETKQETVLYDGDDLGGIVYSADHIDRIFTSGTNDEDVSVIISVRTDGSGLWKKAIDPRDGLL